MAADRLQPGPTGGTCVGAGAGTAAAVALGAKKRDKEAWGMLLLCSLVGVLELWSLEKKASITTVDRLGGK